MASITADLSSAPQGGKTRVYGEGFDSGELIAFYFHGYWSTSLPACAAGSFDGYVDVPNGAPNGATQLAAHGLKSGTQAATAFTIT